MVFPGNRPSNTIIMQRMTPRTLGTLLALYEHKIFTQGIIWNINSFDQMGVELGKMLAAHVLPSFQNREQLKDADSSTQGLVELLVEANF